jgi:hypothetical protein
MDNNSDDIQRHMGAARNQRGAVFDAFRTMCDLDNAALYAVQDKQAWLAEMAQTYHALGKQAQKAIERWRSRYQS